MRVLVLSEYFHPDHSGIANYANDTALYLAEQGHQVTVATSFSWYPAWKKKPEDRGRLFRTDQWNGVRILRGYLFVPKTVSTLGRIIQELSFLLFALVNTLRAGQQDIVVSFTTPISLGVLGAIIAKLRGVPHFINVQDLQLEAASSLDMIGNSPVLKVVERFEFLSYHYSARVSSISDGMLDVLRRKGMGREKLFYWPNWIDVSEAEAGGETGEFRRKFPQFEGKRLLAYAGNIGQKQGLECFVDLAAEYSDREDLAFLIVGGGAYIDTLKSYAAKKGEPVTFMPLLSPEEYSNFLSDVDLLFLSQKKTSKDVYFPSKLLGIWAKGKPVLVAADMASELFRVIHENRLGFAAPYGDAPALNEAFNAFLEKGGEEEVKRSRAYVEQFDRKVVLAEMEKELKTLIGHG